MASGRAIQIIKPVDHKFQLQLESLRSILEADEIKDRYVVVISIAGAYRKGKSFLLNFILKYLYAQYKLHDVSNWIGTEINGFKSRGGRQPETTGIWMWSEVFTHDYENGEKVAIILMDTQGLFENRNNMKDNTTTFAISVMLSSVQCYNVMQNVQENDLQNLELFTGYGRLALRESSGKPFQKLLFIIRDWPNDFEIAYGESAAVVNNLLAETEAQTSENRELRKHIKSSFDQISAFLMPYPGRAVATGQYNGNLQQMDPLFIEYLNRFVSTLCAPENLVVKKISGQKVRAHEFILFMQSYVSIFNGGTLPEPRSILESTVATSNLILFNECLKFYTDAMKKQISDKSKSDQPYFEEATLQESHHQAKTNSLAQFQARPKLGGINFTRPFETRLASEIEDKFKSYRQDNKRKKNDFEAMVKAQVQALSSEFLRTYVESMQSSFSNLDSFFSQTDLQSIHGSAKNGAVTKYRKGKLPYWIEIFFEAGLTKLNDDIQVNFLQFERENEKKERMVLETRRKIEEAKARAQAEARAERIERQRKETEANNANTLLYKDCLNLYINSMRKTLNENTSEYFRDWQLEHFHRFARRDALEKYDGDKRASSNANMTRNRLQSEIDIQYNSFVQLNEDKRREHQAAIDREEIQAQYREMERLLQREQREREERFQSDQSQYTIL